MSNKNNQENKEIYKGGVFYMKKVLASTFTFALMENMENPIHTEKTNWEEIRILANNFAVFEEQEIKINMVVNGSTILINLINAFGHQNTCDVIKARKNIKIKANRISLCLDRNWDMIIPQYRGPRLEEGQTVLPEGAELMPLKVVLD